MILPALNEEEALPVVLDDLENHLADSAEIIVVDDGSTDRTFEVAREHGVRAFRHEQNTGKGGAMATGARQAKGDLLVFMDADATYPAAVIPELVAMLSHFDIVRAERALDSPHIPPLNRLGNRIFNQLLASFHQLQGSDFMSGLYGMTKDAFEALRIESSGFDVEVEIGIKAKQRGLSLGTFDIDYLPRLGDKKLRPVRDGLNILVRMAGMGILYSPTVTFVIPGMVIMALGVVGAIALSGGPVFIGGIGLSVHSFVLAALGILGGFQLVVLGVAAMLYRVESGIAPKPWLLRLATRPVRLGAALLGVAIAALGAVNLIALISGWIASGAGAFVETESLVIWASLFVLGLQVMSAGLFLSIFSGRLAARRG